MASRHSFEKRTIPHPGMRIFKTGLCVFICLLLNHVLGRRGTATSAIAAIISMQSTLRGTLRASVRQLIGTALGGAAGIAMTPLSERVDIEWLYILLMPVTLIAVLYLCVALRLQESATICAFSYVAVLIVPYLDGPAQEPIALAVLQVIDTAVGAVIALLVNRFVAPPQKSAHPNIHLSVETFEPFIQHFSSRLTGLEEMILIDASLAAPEAPQGRDGSMPGPPPVPSLRVVGETIRVPVPFEFREKPYLNGIYLAPGGATVPFYIRQEDGYVDVPVTGRPMSLCWHAPTPEKETYGIMSPRRVYADGQLRPAPTPISVRLRPRAPHRHSPAVSRRS